MDFSMLAELNGEEGRNRRMKDYTITLDSIRVRQLEDRVPNINLSAFFRDVVDRTIDELWENYYINEIGGLQQENEKLRKDQTIDTVNKGMEMRPVG